MGCSILVLGAGRSSSSLISWLQHHAAEFQWTVTVGDMSLKAAQEKAIGGMAIEFDIQNTEKSRAVIGSADIVVSVLPPFLHTLVARLCLEQKKHLLTASYVSDEMKMLHQEARRNNLVFLNECGLDPGIDHMSALQIIDRIRDAGGTMKSFESYTGGLIAPETDPQNPWRYKFTWNPRNVVMAGQAIAKFLQEGQFKYIPYQQLFRQLTPVTVPGYGEYEGYVNRDSLKYREAYGLPDISTMMRGTLRNKGYCAAWDILVQLGCTEDTWPMDSVGRLTHRGFINAFLPYDKVHSVEEKIVQRFQLQPDGPEMQRLKWSGFFDAESIGIPEGTPAQILEHILMKKWKLNSGDKDMVVMWHRFVYEIDGRRKETQASLVATGDNATDTAMAKTVGLPLAFVVKLLVQDKIRSRGVLLPTVREIYDPVLEGLGEAGIKLTEVES